MRDATGALPTLGSVSRRKRHRTHPETEATTPAPSIPAREILPKWPERPRHSLQLRCCMCYKPRRRQLSATELSRAKYEAAPRAFAKKSSASTASANPRDGALLPYCCMASRRESDQTASFLRSPAALLHSSSRAARTGQSGCRGVLDYPAAFRVGPRRG